jgi:hypothetical protein
MIPVQEDFHHNTAQVQQNDNSTKDIMWTELCLFV